MRTRPVVQLLAVSMSVSFAGGSARAQAPAEAPAQPPEALDPDVVGYIHSADRRTLAGHRFIPAADVPWPFTTTSFVADLVIGLGTTTGSTTINGQTFSGNFDYAGIGAFLAYEYAFLDHFSARASITETMFSGINGKSALAVGTEVQFGFGIGATASMRLGDSLQLGLLLDVRERPNIGITIANGLQNIGNTCGTPSGCDLSQLFVLQNVVSVEPALAVSWAVFRPLGFTANVSYIYASSTDEKSKSGSAIGLAAATDFDFGAITSWHVGLLLQFSYTAAVSGGTVLQHVTDLGGGIMYTGRRDLSAGVQFVNRRFHVAPNVDVNWNTWLATIGLRYFW